jgi:hypothetical protein
MRWANGVLQPGAARLEIKLKEKLDRLRAEREAARAAKGR